MRKRQFQFPQALSRLILAQTARDQVVVRSSANLNSEREIRSLLTS